MELTPFLFMAIAFVASIGAGLLGSLLGLGGGIIVVPTLTLLLHVDIRYAIGASIVLVIATSSGAGAAYVREHIANIRVAMFLELATTLGALFGAYLAGVMPERGLFILFGSLMVATAIAMVRQKEQRQREPREDPVADRLRLHGSFFDKANDKEIDYRVCRSTARIWHQRAGRGNQWATRCGRRDHQGSGDDPGDADPDESGHGGQ